MYCEQCACAASIHRIPKHFRTGNRLCHQSGPGCDHIGNNHIGHSKTISATAKNHIGHTENQYRPQPSAKTISATKISATKYTMSLFGVIVTIRLAVSRSPHGEFKRERSLYVSPSTAKNKYLNVKKCGFHDCTQYSNLGLPIDLDSA